MKILGADLKTIGQAKLMQAGFSQMLGIQPALDIQDKYVRVYYTPDQIPTARKKFAEMMEKKPGALRSELRPVVLPYFIKKGAPILIGALAAGYIAGKLF